MDKFLALVERYSGKKFLVVIACAYMLWHFMTAYMMTEPSDEAAQSVLETFMMCVAALGVGSCIGQGIADHGKKAA